MTTDRQGFFRDIKQLGEEYVQEHLNLLKLQSAEKAARMSAVMVTGLAVSLLLFLVLLFLSVMGAYFVFQQTGNWYFGLGAVAAAYLLLAVLLLVLRKTRIYPFITNAVIRLLFEKTDPEHE